MSEIANDNMRPGVRSALDYLKTGGLGEVAGLADTAMRHGYPKVQSDTDMAVALCVMAADAMSFASALARIAAYTPPDQMREDEENGEGYGLDPGEAVEMAYENVISEALGALQRAGWK